MQETGQEWEHVQVRVIQRKGLGLILILLSKSLFKKALNVFKLYWDMLNKGT